MVSLIRDFLSEAKGLYDNLRDSHCTGVQRTLALAGSARECRYRSHRPDVVRENDIRQDDGLIIPTVTHLSPTH
jgi:hypothetical protein